MRRCRCRFRFLFVRSLTRRISSRFFFTQSHVKLFVPQFFVNLCVRVCSESDCLLFFPDRCQQLVVLARRTKLFFHCTSALWQAGERFLRLHLLYSLMRIDDDIPMRASRGFLILIQDLCSFPIWLDAKWHTERERKNANRWTSTVQLEARSMSSSSVLFLFCWPDRKLHPFLPLACSLFPLSVFVHFSSARGGHPHSVGHSRCPSLGERASERTRERESELLTIMNASALFSNIWRSSVWTEWAGRKRTLTNEFDLKKHTDTRSSSSSGKRAFCFIDDVFVHSRSFLLVVGKARQYKIGDLSHFLSASLCLVGVQSSVWEMDSIRQKENNSIYWMRETYRGREKKKKKKPVVHSLLPSICLMSWRIRSSKHYCIHPLPTRAPERETNRMPERSKKCVCEWCWLIGR